MTDRISYAEVVIANGAAVSSEVDLRNHDIVAIEMPGGWTAASISFQSCVRNDGAAGTALTETFLAVVDNAGAEVTITSPAASKYVTLPGSVQQELRGLARTKIVSGTNASNVNQGAARTLRLILGQRT